MNNSYNTVLSHEAELESTSFLKSYFLVKTFRILHTKLYVDTDVRSCRTAFQLICDKLTLAFNDLIGYYE